MSLVYCPECGHEISANAVACPNCGLPINQPPPVVERRMVVEPRQREGFPPWAFVPIGIAALLGILFIFLMMRDSDDAANANLRVNATVRPGQTTEQVHSTSIPSSDPGTVTVPSTGVTSSQSVPSTSTSAPVEPMPTSGTVKFTAKVVPARGSPTSAKGTKFYLLDQDLSTILRDADVEPIEGNSLEQSIGLAAVFPDRYRDFQRAAMKAISSHVKYSGTTGSSGELSIGSVAPETYYLFAVSRVGKGFAMWNAPLSVLAGENNIDLGAQPITEVMPSSVGSDSRTMTGREIG